MTIRAYRHLTVALTALVAACVDGSTSPNPNLPAPSALTYVIGGQLTGLSSGSTVTLVDNGADSLALAADGAFSFAVPVALNHSYAVTVGAQPTGETCTVSKGSGAGVVADVTTVKVTCAAVTFKVGGTVSGLGAGQQATLADNGADPLLVSANGTFAFSTPVAYNGGYAVTVVGQPTGETCTVSSGSGAGVIANITGIKLMCSVDTYTVGGMVSGLSGGTQVTLHDNGADSLTVTANGAFSFSTPVAYNSSYAVTIGTQPTGETCTAANGSGTGVVANVAGIHVICAVDTYTVSGTVSGLSSGAQVTLDDNGDDALTVTANGRFTFATPVAYSSSYAVTVGTQPGSQSCTVSSASGSPVTANITEVAVVCVTNQYTTGGAISGLTGTVVLQNNGSDSLSISTDGAFAFPTPVAQGASYAVTVKTQPVGQTCSVANGTGIMGAGLVSNIAVVCSVNAYSTGGSVTGLAGTLVLENNGGDALTLASDGAFTFATPVAYGSSYAVTVLTQPSIQTCTVANSSGIMGVANVTTVTVTCSTDTFTVGGTLSGLSGAVVLQDNGGDSLTLNSNGPFTFATPVAEGSIYAVTVQTQPAAQTCTLANQSGTVGGSNVTNVGLTCVANVTQISVASTGIIPVGSGPGSIAVTNVGPATANNVSATLPGGWTGVSQDSSNCTSVPPSGTCTLTFSSSTPYVAQAAITVSGDNVSTPPTTALAFSMAGYLVFAVPSSSTALVLQDADATSSTDWSQDTHVIPGIYETSTVAAGAACNGATDGACDTAAIAAYYGTPRTNYAAGFCDQIISDNTGTVALGTWSLPAICELGGAGQGAGCSTGQANIDTNLAQLGFASLSGFYWSSTEYATYPLLYSWVESFATGGGSIQYSNDRFAAQAVRCIRSMSY